MYLGVAFVAFFDPERDIPWERSGGRRYADWAASGGSRLVSSADVSSFPRPAERFAILINGSYVPSAGARGPGAGDACRPLFKPDGLNVYEPRRGPDSGRLPTYCGSMTYLSAGVLEVQAALAGALGDAALERSRAQGVARACKSDESETSDGQSTNATAGSQTRNALDLRISYAQAPLPAYERTFGSLTVRLFASVYLTASLSSLLGAAAATAREDVASGFRVSAVLSGLSPRAYELGTACVLVAANLSSAACLSFLTCFLGLFAWDSLAAIFLLAGAFAAGLAPLGFFLAAVFERRPLAVQQSAVTMMQIVAPLLYVPLAYFGAHSGAFFFFSFLFSPVAFAAAVDVATQAEAGRAPLTLANLASPTIGRDVRLGGDGGAHAMSAAAALGVLVLDAFAYAFAAWYVRRAREKGGDFWFAFRKRYWRGSKLFGDAFSDSDAKRHEVAVEMDDPSRGGRYEVIGLDEEEAEGETAEAEAEAEADEDGSQVADGPSRSTAAHLPSSARTGPPALAPAIQLERVCALADPRAGGRPTAEDPSAPPRAAAAARRSSRTLARFSLLFSAGPLLAAPR